MAAEPETRYERKFVVEDTALPQLLRAVGRNPAVFRPIFHPRWVNSVYLDSPGLADFRAHVAGSERRIKMRVRWYGERVGAVAKPVLEIKARYGHAGQKHLAPLEPFEYRDALRLQQVRLLPHATLEPALRARLVSSVPVALTRYQRYYFRSEDKRFRLTLDTELSYHAVGPRLGYLRHYPERRLSIVELKYDVADDDKVARITGALPVRLHKFSKYVAAVEHLGAALETGASAR
jgi:hypothetical protein